jgi:hypothetical protein
VFLKINIMFKVMGSLPALPLLLFWMLSLFPIIHKTTDKDISIKWHSSYLPVPG